MFTWILCTFFITVRCHNIAGRDYVKDAIFKINKRFSQEEGLFEADIKTLAKLHHLRIRRNAVKDKTLIWKSKNVPYEMDKSLSSYTRLIINAAITELEKYTCVRFRQRGVADKYGVKFIKGNGCWSAIGRPRFTNDKKYQEVSIGHGCTTKTIILHELMHLLGFYHEHSRYDRDKYIKVRWENIKPGAEKYFQLVKKSVSNIMVPGYDYESIMQYGRFEFTSNGKPTLEAKDDPLRKLGQKNSLSKGDVEKINILYSCKKKSPSAWSKWTKWSGCKDDGKKTRVRYCLRSDLNACPNAGQFGFEIEKKIC